MKRSIYLALTALMISGLSACTSYNYYTAAINKTNLSAYRTFAWMPPPSGKQQRAMLNNEADAKIKDAATSALVMKGLKLDQREPDLIVSYTTTVGRGARTNYYTPGYGYYGGWGYPGWGLGYSWGWGGFYRPYYYAYGGPFLYGGPTYKEKEHYKEGTLIIDLIDPRTRRIVWRGFGVGEVHKNHQKDIDDLPKVVDGVLDQLQLMPSRNS
ncbi:MAG TPA: DUF4136 domain-containing protein [Mucilaginibacter sp.]|nr:DUF4136 domain-containing protein [Mucilaginibacter sp.]